MHFWKYGPFGSSVPGERVGWGRLEGEGEEWQLGACPSYGWWAPHLALLMDGGPAPNLCLLEGGGQLQFIQHLFGFQLVRQLSLGIGRIWEWAVLPSWGSG